MQLRWLPLLMIGLLTASTVQAQRFRPGLPPPPISPGNLPPDFGQNLNPWGNSPLPGWPPGGWTPPPPGLMPPPQVLPLNVVQPPPGGVTVYRMYLQQTGEYIDTPDFTEAVRLIRTAGFRYVGVPYYLEQQGGPGYAPLARGIRPSGGRFLTTSPATDNRGQIEGVMGFVQVRPTLGWALLYEWYLPQRDLFYYTLNPRGDFAPAAGYRPSGAPGYVLPAQ